MRPRRKRRFHAVLGRRCYASAKSPPSMLVALASTALAFQRRRQPRSHDPFGQRGINGALLWGVNGRNRTPLLPTWFAKASAAELRLDFEWIIANDLAIVGESRAWVRLPPG